MKWLKFFEQFEQDEDTTDVLYIFDFDETLIKLDENDNAISTKQYADIYSKVTNKSIVTGRPKERIKEVEDIMNYFGISNPNWGLFCSPHGEDESKIPGWKAETIVKLLKDSEFKKAKFYDDKPDWVETVKQAVEKNLPDVKFEGITAI